MLEGSWLDRGMHINAIGANFPQKHELDGAAVRRCDIIVADSREQSKIEAGDLIQMYGDDERRWDGVDELARNRGREDSRPQRIPSRSRFSSPMASRRRDVVVAGTHLRTGA